MADDLFLFGNVRFRQPGDQRQRQGHGSGGLAVVVFIAHAGGFGQDGFEVDAPGGAHGFAQGRAVHLIEPGQIGFYFFIVQAPAQAFGVAAGMNGRIAPATKHLVLRHDHRHAGAGDHAGGVGNAVILGGAKVHLARLHQLPGFLHAGGQLFVHQRAADGSTDGRGDLVGAFIGRAGMKHRVFRHAGNGLHGGLHIHPYGLTLQQDVHHLRVGLVDLLFHRHCSISLLKRS